MAGKDLGDESLTKKIVTQIEYLGEKLILPVGMTIDNAVDLLQRRKKYEEEPVNIMETFGVFPWDGAAALNAVLKDKYGWATQEPTPGWFGSQPPSLVAIETGPNETMNVPWGRFSLPGVKGHLETSVDRKNDMMVFRLVANVLRKDESIVKDIFSRLKTYLKEKSIYRGKALKIRFFDDQGDPLNMPTINFLDTSKVDPNMLVYPEEVQDSINTNLFVPIQRVPDLVANGIPIKRGVLLGGTYGTGKTMAAHVASKHAVDNGITFIYVARADELACAIGFAMQYQSPAAVVFCEDIDRAMNGERTVEIDDILNIIDGIDSKKSNLMVMLTTNHLDNINPAMLRPGRLDAVIDVKAPDAPAVEKLIRLYAGAALSATEDIKQVANTLSGKIPAVIAEVVKRAKLAQLGLQEKGTKVTGLNAKALMIAANTMNDQLNLLYKDRTPAVPTLDGALNTLVESASKNAAERALRHLVRDDLLN